MITKCTDRLREFVGREKNHCGYLLIRQGYCPIVGASPVFKRREMGAVALDRVTQSDDVSDAKYQR